MLNYSIIIKMKKVNKKYIPKTLSEKDKKTNKKY